MNVQSVRWFFLFAVGLVFTASAQNLAPRFPEGKDGFKSYISDLLRLAESGQSEALAARVQDAELPDARAWMVASLGRYLGESVARGYAARRADVGPFLIRALNEVSRENFSNLEVIVRKGASLELDGKPPYISGVSIQVARPLTLFGARFTASEKPPKKGEQVDGIGIWYFVYVGGAYRYVGLLEPGCAELPAAQLATGGQSTQPARVGGTVQQARLVRMVRPAYPALAKQARIKGTVRLQVIIDKQGCLQKIEVLEGHPLLIQAALDSVRGWAYIPTLLDGEPVEVISTIDVVFQL
jgi:TonB family protein